MAQNTYATDLAFMAKHTKIVELTGPGDARVAVAPAWQGRVMTSTFSGGSGTSFGWINEPFIAAGKEAAWNNYGGEDRFWLGPEGGQFSLWYRKGEPFDIDHWLTPPGFSSGRFQVTSQGKRSVAMVRQFDVTNFSGTAFSCAVRRTIRSLAEDQAAEQLGVSVPSGVAMAGFETSNTLTNTGEAAWTRAGGLVSVWVLGMMKPLPRGRVIVPFVPGDEKTFGPKATTDYFGAIPPERCAVAADHVSFACDGQFRAKIGVSPARSRGVFGSYDPDGRNLTIVQFNQPGGAAKLPYVNSLWQIQDAPFAGDAINSYNDGPARPGADFCGFYELETSSPAAELKAGEAITHVHRTFHFGGPVEALNEISRKVLGVDLTKIA